MDDVGTNDLFPSVATDAEKALGFKEAIIDAPNGAYFGDPDRIRVVTLQLDEDRFAIKMRRPDGVVTYAIWSATSGGPVEPGDTSLDSLGKRLAFIKKVN